MQGVIVNGCIRDSQDIAEMSLGVKALGTHPLKSSKRDPGLRDVPVSFAGVIPSPLPHPHVLNRRHMARSATGLCQHGASGTRRGVTEGVNVRPRGH